MAVITRRVGLSNPTAGSHVTFYTVPTGKVAILRNAVLAFDGTATNVTSGLIIGGAGFVWDTRIAHEFAANVYQLATVMRAGEGLAGMSNTSPGYLMVTVAEMDVEDAPTAFRLELLNIQAQKGWTCPAGKKFRVREMVVTPHSDTANVNIYVGGIGYLLRAQVGNFQPVVQQLDFVIHAGENLGAVASGGTFHLWLSGTLEDA